MRALLVSLHIFLLFEFYGQDYHYSTSYESDTTIYQSKIRELLHTYTKRDTLVREKPNPQIHAYWWKELVEERPIRRSEGWDLYCKPGIGLDYFENDTFRCTIEIPCSQWGFGWKREFISETKSYSNGNRCTSGEFLVFSTQNRRFAIPVNRHIFYTKKGRIRSIATFSKYGEPISDSLFTRRGRFKKIKEIRLNEQVPSR